VIAAALAIMDVEGVEAVTMRRIGRELGVEAMSLYRHVRDKEDILDGISEAVMSEFVIPESTGDWGRDLRAMASEWRRLLGLHPGVMQLLAERHKPLEGLAAYRPMDAALDALCRAGLTPRECAQAFNALGGYIMGFVMMEQGLMPGHDPAEHAHQHREVVEALRGAGLPRLVECFEYFSECPTDEQFEFGLDLMVRGLEAGIERAGRAERPGP
jgi:AcrR family transcriptional regulator